MTPIQLISRRLGLDVTTTRSLVYRVRRASGGSMDNEDVYELLSEARPEDLPPALMPSVVHYHGS